jgi:hypothetical protein
MLVEAVQEERVQEDVLQTVLVADLAQMVAVAEKVSTNKLEKMEGLE